MDNMFNNLNDEEFQDNSNFEMPEDYDFIGEYEQLMADLDNQDPMDIIPEFNETDDFYQAIDNWDNGEYIEEPLDKYSKRGKGSYNKFKEDENEFKKEFAEELTMLYDLLDEANKFNKKLTKKYDTIEGNKAKGTSKYVNDLIESVLSSTTNRLQIIKEINSLKKNIQELKIKADGKYAKMGGDGSLEDDANSFKNGIMKHAQYTLTTYRSELMQVVPIIGWWMFVNQQLDSMFAGEKTLSLSMELISLIIKGWFSNSDEMLYDRGVYKGEDKRLVKLRQLVPVWRQVNKATHLGSTMSYYNRYSDRHNITDLIAKIFNKTTDDDYNDNED